jgi:hypothetical protein
MNRNRTKSEQPILPGIEGLLIASTKSAEARQSIRAFIKMRPRGQRWRGEVLVPPGSFLQVAVDAFRETTDIPLEIPAGVAMSLVSTRLVQNGSVIDFAGSLVSPALWTVILAASGAGKTFAANALMKFTDIRDTFPEPASAAKFVEDLSNHNRTIWVRDEFGQLLKAVDQQTHMAELRDYMLRLYDGKAIERNTKKEQIKIDDPALVVLGMTVAESFKDCVPAEAMVDGFAQRFLYTVARNDPKRPPLSVPIYEPAKYKDEIETAWRALSAISLHPVYTVSPQALAAFTAMFRAWQVPGDTLPPSFFRRVMFAAVRYAAVYHLLLGDGGSELTQADFGWAGRMVGQHLDDAREILNDYGLSELERLVRRAEEVKADLAAQGKRCTPRDLSRRMNALKTAAQARAILALIEDDEQATAQDQNQPKAA